MSEQVFKEKATLARQQIRMADHMFKVTYPLVKDPKLLVGIVENMDIAMMNALESFLTFERFFRRVPAFSKSREGMLAVFAAKINQYHFDSKFITHMHDVHTIVQAHKDSAIEFTKKEKLVMASQNYTLNTLSAEKVKVLLEASKKCVDSLLKKIEEQNYD